MILNAGTVSYLHMHTLVELHGWLAELMPLPVDDRGGVDRPAGRLTHGERGSGSRPSGCRCRTACYSDSPCPSCPDRGT